MMGRKKEVSLAFSLPSHDSLRFQFDPVSLDSGGTEKTTQDESAVLHK